MIEAGRALYEAVRRSEEVQDGPSFYSSKEPPWRALPAEERFKWAERAARLRPDHPELLRSVGERLDKLRGVMELMDKRNRAAGRFLWYGGSIEVLDSVIEEIRKGLS